ncbi:MAG: PAS domain S-box protein [Anaerolineaceae bacterium]|nr:PAS domain S-box protein [Anaerolineaceae bacterium]
MNESGLVLFSSPKSIQRFQLREKDLVEWVKIEGKPNGGLTKPGDNDFPEILVNTVFDLFWHGEKARMVLLDTSQFQEQVFREIASSKTEYPQAGQIPWLSFTCKTQSPFDLISIKNRAEELTGFSINQLISNNMNSFRRLMATDDRGGVFQKIQEAVDSNSDYQVVYRIRHSSGEVRWVQEQGQRIVDPATQTDLISGWILDVSQQRQTQDALWESESRYQSFVEASPDAVFMLDKDGHIVLANEQFHTMMGMDSADELLGTNILKYLDADSRKVIDTDFQTLMATFPIIGRVFRLQTRNDGIIPIETNVTTIRGSQSEVYAYVVIARDIRQRVMAEQALRESEARYRAIVEDNPEMIVRFQPDSTVTFANAAFCRFVKLNPEELLGSKLSDKIVGAGHHLIDRLLSLVTPMMEPIDNEFTIHTANNVDRWYRWKTIAIKDVDGQFLEYQSIGEDITNHKLAQKAELESENRLRELMENIKLVALILDVNGRVAFSNSYFSEISGWVKEEINNQDWVSKFIPLDQRVTLRKLLIESALHGHIPQHNENSILCKNGDQRLIAWNNTILRDASGEISGIASLGEDITEKNLSEKIQEIIFKISLSANESDNLQTLYKSIHNVLKNLMPVENFFIALYDSELDQISFPYFVDEYDPQPEPFKPGKGLTEYVLRTGKTTLVNPETFEKLVENGEVISIGTPSVDWIGVPLKVQGKIIGMMGAQTYSPGIRYSERDEQILGFVSTQVAMAIERKRSEQALRTSQKRNQLLVEASTDAIFTARLDGSITDCNDVATSLYGYSRNEILSLHFNDLISAEYISEILDPSNWDSKDSHFIRDIPNIRKNGVEFPAEISIRQTTVEGVPVLVSFVRDITAQKQAAKVIVESEEKFRTLAENTAAGVFIHQNGKYVYVNPTWCQIIGYSGSELLNTVPENALISGANKQNEQGTESSKTQIPLPERLERTITTRNGEKRIIDLYLSAIMLENQPAVIGTAVDITNRKQREHELEVIAEMGEAYRINNNREEVLSIAILKLVDILKADGVFIEIVDIDESSNTMIKATGDWKHLELKPVSIGEGLSGHLIKTGQPYLNTEASKDPYILYPDLLEGFKSVAGVPLITSGFTIGAVVIGAKHAFSENDLRLLRAISDLTASALQRTALFEKTRLQADELKHAYNSTLEGWALALELRDKETQGHSVRIANLAVKLARRMGIPEDQMEILRRGALLHDIGKLGVPDTILLKQGKLTGDDWVIMQKHPTYAYEMLSQIKDFRESIDIPYCHHEWWDGSGYPRGLEGEQIPLAARIFSIIDVWDALTSDRPYRPAWQRKEAMAHIINQAGTHFDPSVVDEFVKMIMENK